MAAASLIVKLSAQVSEFQKSFNDALGTTSAFERKFAGVASSVADQQQRINKAFASFAGDTIVRDANAFAEAIARVGGASKLTASEQQRANATVTEAIAKYAALGQTAPAALVALAKATAQIQPIKNPFSGTDLIGQANAYVQAISQIGGASKLTEAEQQKVNKTVTEAIGKYAALGQTAPQSLLNLAKATAQIKPLPENLFSGTAVISQANQYAQAITAIGGASKLTASEQRTVSASVAEALEKYKALGQTAPKALQDLARETASVEAPTTRAQKAMSLLQSTFGQFTAASLAASAIRGVISGIGDAVQGLVGIVKEAVTKSAEFNNAFLGLGSIAAAFGQDMEKVRSAAKGLSADGLLPLKDSAAGLKNLLSSGFGLDESVKLINAFKDSAAFGRQSALSFGDAVRSATEGVKNQNSTLVDNAGVTKNLSVILKEAGFQMQDLSDKTKGIAARQALFNGILRETAAQQGDAAKAANTYSGQLSALDTAYGNILVTVGNAITQNRTVSEAIGAVSAAFRTLDTSLGTNQRAFNLVSDAIIGFVRLLAGIARAIDTAQQAFNGLDTVLRTMVKGLSDSVKAIGDLLIGIVSIAAKIPGGAAAIGIAADEITSLIIVTAKAGEVSKNMADALQKNQERVTSWHASLGGTAKSLDGLATSLEKTRGQVVALGGASGVKGGPLAPLAESLSGAGEKAKGFSAQLQKLASDIDRAAQNGTPLPELMKLFGSEASKSAEKAAAWGIKVKASVSEVAAAFNQSTLTKTLTKLDDQFGKFFDSRAQGQFKKLQAAMHESAEAMVELPKTLAKLDDGFTAFANKRFEQTFERLSAKMKSAEQVAAELGNTFGKVFTSVGVSLVQDFAQGFQQGGLIGAMVSVAGGAADKFGGVFKAGLDRVIKDTAAGLSAELTFGERAAGWGAVAAQSFVTGFESGLQNPGTISALTSVASGFVSGLVLGPIGAGVGAAIGLAGYLAGAFQNAREEARAVGVEQNKLLTQFHGLPGLTDAADRAGFSIPNRHGGQLSLDDSIRFLTQTNDVDAFNAAVARLNQSLDEYNERLKSIASATDAVNARSAVFSKQFEPLVAKRTAAKESGDTGAAAVAGQQIQELAQRTQPEFERIGLFVKDAFAGMVKETGNAIGAIQALAPSFGVLKSGITDFGLTSTGVIDTLLGNFDLLNNDAFKPFFDNIQSTGQITKGLFDANALSPEGFQAAAADIGQSIQEIVNRGGDLSKTLALSQPVLQSLYEAQQTFGLATDQTTQSILNQAKEQGLVGEQFKSTNEKILDILFQINKVLGGDIPASMQALPGVAAEVGAGIGTGLGAGLPAASNEIDVQMGGALRRVKIPAGEAGDELRKAIETQAAAAGASIETKVGGAMRALHPMAKDVGNVITTELSAAGPASAARIEAALRNCWGRARTDAKDAASGITSELANIKTPKIEIPDIDVRVKFNTDDFPDFGGDVPALANGGIVKRPTLALIGEAGPEAVVPLSRMSGPSGGGSRDVILQLDKRELGRVTLEAAADEAYVLGLVPR